MNAHAKLASALCALPMAACATAMDSTRNGQPVIDTTVSAILDDSDEWEGKWVRVFGWADRNATLLVDKKEDYDSPNDLTLYLDPASKLARDDSASGLPEKIVVVSGQVDLTCVHAWRRGYDALVAQGIAGDIRLDPEGSYAYCNRAAGTILVNVLVATPPERAQ